MQGSTVDLVEAPASPQAKGPAVPTFSATPGRGRWLVRSLGRLASVALALGCVGGLVYLGQKTGWALPKFSALRGEAAPEPDDWCEEHSVPESECVECGHAGRPRGHEYGWCAEHGVHECPLCHADVAQTPSPPTVTSEDRERAARALTFAPRAPNGKTCRLHERRIQIASTEVADRLGIAAAPVTQAPVAEVIEAPGEIGYDPTRVARLSSRARGTVWRVERQVGDKVKKGDVLALVDAAEVGRAKAEFQQALTQLKLKTQTLARLRELGGDVIPGQGVFDAEAAVEEARVRLLTTEQALLNLGLPAPGADVRTLSPADLARRMQFLGLPDQLAQSLAGRTGSSNLLAVAAPLDGEVVERSAVAGQAADPSRPLFVVADTSRMWLTLRVRLEDVDRVRPGQPVRFHHPGHTGEAGGDAGTVVWVSPAADERTRTVPVRVDLTNPGDRHPAHTFGTARVVLRQEPYAVVVPSEAVHWEGCCHVVFVRDKGYEKPGAPKVFHVRKVRPGAENATPAGSLTEVIAGVLPGEWVATTNSGVLRSELLKNDLGAG